jgi:iron complex transport system substrate-binding protein
VHQPLVHSLLSRRQLLLAGLAGAATVALAACGGDDDSTGSNTAGGDQASTGDAPSGATASTTAAEGTTTATGTALTFVDDRGETITFSKPPQRVVAWQAIVPALVELGITPVGVIAFNDLATNPAFIDAGVDVPALTAVSTSYGEVDIEALAALQPDVILTYTFGGEFLQGFTDGTTQDLAAQVAPFVALDANADVMTGIGRMEEFAALLGADLDSERLQAAATAFDAAVAELTDLIESKPGLTVGFGGPAPTGFFLAPVDSYPELQFYAGLGMDIASGSQDSVVSWELVGDVPIDVLLIDDRSTADEIAEADAIPTWKTIPAVGAGQYSATWRFLLSYCRADYARTIERMLPTLRTASPDIV